MTKQNIISAKKINQKHLSDLISVQNLRIIFDTSRHDEFKSTKIKRRKRTFNLICVYIDTFN